jgi:hypothetical protein
MKRGKMKTNAKIRGVASTALRAGITVPPPATLAALAALAAKKASIVIHKAVAN